MPGSYIPDWYMLIKAARYLGVPPWELAEKNSNWQQMALTAENVEARVYGRPSS